MSIPIEFSVCVQTKEFYGTLVQLKDGSVYIIRNDELEPVSRSYAGGAIKDSIKYFQHEYVADRKYYKLSIKSKDYVTAEQYKRQSELVLEALTKMRKCWKMFKAQSKKKIKPVTQEALKKKTDALRAKKLREQEKLPNGTIKVSNDNKDVTISHTVPMENFQHGPK